MKRKINNLTKIKISGGNTVNFINNCIANNINLRNINRTSSTEVEFEISDEDYLSLSKIDNRDCQVSVIEYGGKKKFLNYLLYRSGFIIGLLISVVLFIFMNNRLLQIHITGLVSTNKELVMNYLNEIGVSKLSYMDYNIADIENSLAKEFSFSLVSIITKGNSLVISVKEELPSIEDSYVPITADYNMVIRSITVYSGTARVVNGDIVYKGDILVEPFVKSGDSTVFVSPCAEIVAEVFFSNTYLFNNSIEEFVKTGKKEIVNSQINLGKFTIENNKKDTSFSDYVLVDKEINISTVYLPINIKKTYAYEVTKTIVDRDFESERDGIILSQKEKLYLGIPKDITIEQEEVDIVEISNGYIINIYLMTIINLRYS